MNDDDARKLATWMIDTWPNGPKAYIWQGVMRDLDPSTARVAYQNLARTAERAPTPGQYSAEYNRLKRHETPSFGPVRHDPNAIGLDEYLTRLTARAQTIPDAADELANWERWLKRKENA